MTPALAFFNCASRPEYIKPLRREAKDVVLGVVPGGPTTLAHVPRLRKQCGFLNKSHRAHPLLLLMFRRIVLADKVLYDDEDVDTNCSDNTGGGGGDVNGGNDKPKL
jgi:hypothetical protein